MKAKLPLVAVLLFSVFSPSALSDDGKKESASEEIKKVREYRELLMEAMSKHMKATSMLVKGEVDLPAERLAQAQALHSASISMLELFPKGSGPDVLKTEAKAEVWTKWSEFEAANKTYADATALLVEAAKSGDKNAFNAQFSKVGRSCGGCHDSFREDDH